MNTLKLIHKKSNGFTVIELLVATAVFSVVLLVITTGIIQITRVYYKGITESNTQGTARDVMDTIGQAIQFGGGTVSPTNDTLAAGTPGYTCVGSQQFSYVLGWELEDNPVSAKHQTLHALQRGDLTGSCGTGTTSNDKEIFSPHMRLANLSVKNVSGNIYSIAVTIAYGDDDLLNNPLSKTPTCRPNSGSQFCYVTTLNTTVVKRVD